VLWAVYDTGNYDYIVEYGFHDDGMISMRVGASGFNAFAWEPHMHTASWRVDVDLAYPNEPNVIAATGAQGATRVMWSGFDLRPRDLFDQTPLIGPREK
jgi:Cu2+-containing amine oxidase